MPGCAPKPETTGIWRVSEAQKASMVWMRRRWAISPAFGRFLRTLSRISAAALMVKVMATISSGFCTVLRSAL